MPAPNQNRTKVSSWQDPIFGYFESHGKMEFKPGESYDLTPKQKQGVMERHQIKELLKMEYLKREFDPIARRYHPGVMIDPAMFRWYAADMSHLEVFRMTPKTFFWGFVVLVVPCYLFAKSVTNAKNIYSKRCREGKYLWWDKEHRRVTTSGGGYNMYPG